MKYEWDQDKSDANLEKHGLSFEDAPLVFGGKCVREHLIYASE